jgi:hypothetical protein
LDKVIIAKAKAKTDDNVIEDSYNVPGITICGNGFVFIRVTALR